MTPEQYVPEAELSSSHLLEFSRRIREARLAKGLTQDELAAACGVTDRAVRNWESGERQPRGRYWPQIEAALGHSIAWFMRDGDDA